MKKNEPVSKIMSRELTSIHQAEPLSKLRKLFDELRIHHIPVVSGESLVGIISSNDLIRVSFGEFGQQDGKTLDAILDHTFKLTDVMTRNPTTIDPHGTIRDAARILAASEFHCLPVVEGDKLVGMVTSTDLMSYLADL